MGTLISVLVAFAILASTDRGAAEPRASVAAAPAVGATADLAVLAGADLPIEIARLVTGSSSHVDIKNTAAQPVTAWVVVVSTPTPTGTHRDVETIDGYLSEATRGLPRSSDRTNRLMPGESRQLSLGSLPPTATVQISAVVLDDGTALGDPEAINAIFDQRAKERDALKEVVETFRSVLEVKHGKDALDELKRRFDDTTSTPETAAHLAARDAVDSYLRRATPENVAEIDRLLREYVSLVSREYDLAVRHSQRRTG